MVNFHFWKKISARLTGMNILASIYATAQTDYGFVVTLLHYYENFIFLRNGRTCMWHDVLVLRSL